MADVLVLRVASARYDDDHPGWRRQVDVLRERLRAIDEGPEPGAPSLVVATGLDAPDTVDAGRTKGVVDLAAVVLSSAHVLRAAAEVINQWRAQDGSRSVRVKITRPDEIIEIDGTGGAGVRAAGESLRALLEDQDR